MRGKSSTYRAVKATCRIASGCSSCTPTAYCARRFGLKTPFAGCAPCSAIARAWWSARRCGLEHLQKALNEMNLHLHHVLTDLSGQSGLAILDAILAGERDPKKLAALADRRVKQPQAQIEAALTGDYRPELLFVVDQALENYRQLQHQIAQCDLAIEKQLASMADGTRPKRAAEATPPPSEA